MQIDRLEGPFGMVVSGADPRHLTDEDLKHLLLTLYRNRFVVIKTGGLSQDDYLAFARRVGEPIRINLSEADYPEIAKITNVGIDIAKEKKSAAHWHSDQSFKKEVSSVTMLYSVQAPDEGGDTLFCDLAGAYAALSETDRTRIDDLIVEHRHGVSIASRPGDHVPVPPRGWDQSTTVRHPLVRKHPVTGERTLYAITGTSQGIVGMNQEEARQLLQDLCDHAFQEPFLSQHHHEVHDLVLWDNPTTMHSASPIGAATGPHDTRLIHRISLRGYPSFFDTTEAR